MEDQTTVPQCNITHEGIEIICDDRYANFPPQEAAMMLHHLGYIHRYSFKKGRLMVMCDIVEEFVKSCGSLERVISGRSLMTWDYFSRNFKLDDMDAIVEMADYHDHILFETLLS